MASNLCSLSFSLPSYSPPKINFKLLIRIFKLPFFYCKDKEYSYLRELDSADSFCINKRINSAWKQKHQKEREKEK